MIRKSRIVPGRRRISFIMRGRHPSCTRADNARGPFASDRRGVYYYNRVYVHIRVCVRARAV